MKFASCHPDRLLIARGLCRSCYNKHWHQGDVAQFAHTMIGKKKVPQSFSRKSRWERKSAIRSLDAFCEMQKLRLMGQDVTYVHPLWDMEVGKAYDKGAEYVLTPEELHALYREQRLGPQLNRVDRQEDRIVQEYRR